MKGTLHVYSPPLLQIMVYRSLLLSKLSQLDLPPCVLNWIISFLTCHSQVIKCGKSISLPLHINCSIIQGSGVGPTSQYSTVVLTVVRVMIAKYRK